MKKFISCRRTCTLFLLVIWLLLCYFLSKDYRATLLSLKARALIRISRETTTTLWILPRGEMKDIPNQWKPPQNWTILVNPEESKPHCRSCYQSEPGMTSFLEKWTNQHPLPDNSSFRLAYTRMASAIIAISHGAVNILTTSDLKSLNRSMSRLLLDNQPDGVRGIEYIGERLTLDSFHFLHRSVITSYTPCKYRLRRRMTPLWTIGVRCQAATTLGESPGTLVSIDDHSPPIFSTIPKLSISGFSDAFFDYEGLWALFPSFLPGSAETSVWGLWAQRMLQELGHEMAITSLPCPDNVEVTTIVSEPQEITQRALSYVRNWQCHAGKPFFECALNLGHTLVQADIVKIEEIKLLSLWIKELRNSHYIEPVRRFHKSLRKEDLLLGCIIHNPARVVPGEEEISQKNPFPNIFPFCKNLPKRDGVVFPFHNHRLLKSSKVEDIALIIIFYDSSIYANIQFLQDLYAKYFQHVIYCGPNFNKFYTTYQNLKAPLSFIEVPDTKGFVAYECVSRAIMMNFDVKGYLEMADDVILNTWTLGNIPRDRFWFQKDLRTASRHQQIMNDFALSYPFPWWPWTVHGQMWGAKAMANVWKKFEFIQRQNNTKSKQIVNAFLRTLQHNSGSYDRFFYCSSDIFYVPSKFRQSWAMLSDIFFSNNVFLDIAVPTLMNGMDSTANIIRMEGIYLWYNDRGNYPAHYRNYHQFFHPWKMGWIHRSDHANFLCFHLLPNIVNDLMAPGSQSNQTRNNKTA